MANERSFRYWVGKSVDQIIDAAVAAEMMPGRFPAGMHLEFDLRRFLGQPVRLIIDGGANVGDTSLRFSKFFRDATIHCFEPVGKTFEILKSRASANPKLILNKLALGDQEMQISIKLSDDSELNSILNPETSAASANSEMIQVVCLDKYAETNQLGGIDLLKLDLEGYELPALRGAKSLLEKGLVKAVYAECGFVRKDAYKTYVGLLDEYLVGQGFMFSGFYQTFRWGPNKRWSGFSNGLWLRP